jgi:hypothetical protein
MDERDDITGLLSQLRFRTPPLETVWQRSDHRFRLRWRMAAGFALTAALLVSAVAAAAGTGLLTEMIGKGGCPPSSVLCGSDYRTFGLRVDRVDGVEMVNVVVRDGLSRDQIQQIASRVATDTSAGPFLAGPTWPTPPPGMVKPQRIVVYVFRDMPALPDLGGNSPLPSGAVDASPAPEPDGFPADPVSGAAANPPVSQLRPYWLMTYDLSPDGASVVWT